jgi:hypothetical protein
MNEDIRDFETALEAEPERKQGKIFVGSGTINSNGLFTVTIGDVSAGQYLTATATDAAGTTPDFSRNVQVGG